MGNSLSASALVELDRILSRHELRPEDTERRESVLLPLEEALAPAPEPPAPRAESGASRVAVCLWSKRHPERADIQLLIMLSGDREPLVRFSALEALSQLLATRKAEINPRLLYRLQASLQERSRVEESVLVSYTAKRVVNEIQQLSDQQFKPASRVIANPYVAGLPVRGKRFFGRQDVLKEIRETLESIRLKILVLQGARRTGKTSLLYQIQDGALGDKFVPVYVDMQTLAGTPLSTLVRSWMRCVETEVSKRQPDARLPAMEEEMNVDSLRQFLRAALQALAPASLLLLVDEYEVLQTHLQDRDAAMQLKAMIEDEPHLMFIFAGTQKLETSGAGNLPLLLEIGKIIKVTFLKPDEALALITEQAEGVFEYEQDVPQRVMALSACHPFYVQLLCQGLVEIARETNRRATVEDLEVVVRRFIENPSPHVLLGWKALDRNEKLVAAAGAELESRKKQAFTPKDVTSYLRGEEYPIRFGPGEVQQVLRILTDSDWFKKEKGAQAYRYTIELVRRWVAEYRSIWDLLADQRPGEGDLAGLWRQRWLGYWTQASAWVFFFPRFGSRKID
jgi:hypothetical protein